MRVQWRYWTPRFALTQEWRNKNIKYFISSSEDRTNKKSSLQSHTCFLLQLAWPMTCTYNIDLIILLWHMTLHLEASRGAEAQSVTVKSTGCGFDPHSRKWYIYLRFHFWEAKRGIEFRHSTRNASRTPRKVGNEVC